MSQARLPGAEGVGGVEEAVGNDPAGACSVSSRNSVVASELKKDRKESTDCNNTSLAAKIIFN